ncbi:H-NS family nucleoid-associated regulatory protein [Ralstonia soli]|uniref:H-NS histone family protein n=1 Tax=Ralstonia soli TaxID=2953896 RepID=A0ABT1AE59_9RALS|nr:H-NS histone family protein [Ralstonia soli]MCO5396670.1 H-NS histone family protein [Ralstonia soli]
MPTYRQLVAQKAELDGKIEAARLQELQTVILQIRQIMEEYGLTAEDIGLAPRSGRYVGKKAPLVAKYRDPKSGATWSGRGRAPAWIAGKNRNRFLIA